MSQDKQFTWKSRRVGFHFSTDFSSLFEMSRRLLNVGEGELPILCLLEYVIGKIYFTTSVLFFGAFVYHLYIARSASNFQDT